MFGGMPSFSVLVLWSVAFFLVVVLSLYVSLVYVHSARSYCLHDTCVVFVCISQSAPAGAFVPIFPPCVLRNGGGLPLVGPLVTLVFVGFWLVFFGNRLRLPAVGLCEPFPGFR